MGEKPYNPLDYENLTINLVRELMSRPLQQLPPDPPFEGPGVYALFYSGAFPPYVSIASPKATRPIYVGKAVPPGARTGRRSTASGRPLYGRLREHAESITATTLQLGDFACRYLVVVPLWITMAERFLMEHYRPVWNVCIEGFGIHDPGSGRYEGEISWWDALHPGRSFAANLRQTRTEQQAIARLGEFLSNPQVAATALGEATGTDEDP